MRRRSPLWAALLSLALAAVARGQTGYATVAGFPSIPYSPNGALVSDANGFLWGTSNYNATGGAGQSSGTIFRVDPSDGSVKVMAQLPDSGGQFVQGAPGLTDDGQGFFWGATLDGGLNEDGTIFKVEASTGHLATVAIFDDSSIKGSLPLGLLVSDGQGFLWGVTYGGGQYGGGTIFKIEIATGQLTAIHEFSSNEVPQGGLAGDGAGALWGATSGSETLYKVDITTGAFTVMVNFDDAVAKGQEPNGSLLNDGAGHFFGSTASGGSVHRGNIYQVDITTSHVTVKAEFDGVIVTGTRPGPLTLDAQGQLWGVTNNGGSAGTGSVFRLDTTNTLSDVFSFDDSTVLGSSPAPLLYVDSTGHLDGATNVGALAGRGSIFQIDPAAATLVTLAQFRWEQPSRVQGPLTPDGQGNLWGSAPVGGGSEYGSIFRVAEQTGQITIVQALTGPSGVAKGTRPQPLLLTSDGNFWGGTAKGGTADLGTIFRLNPTTGDFSTMIEFTGTTGQALGTNPAGSLTADGQGNLWGSTQKGGGGDFGTVFKYNLASGTLTTVVEFTGTGGAAPGSTPGTLQSDGAGNLWGTTYNGGAGDFGTIFKINLQSSSFTSVYAFAAAAGPYDGMVSDGHGLLWGTTNISGTVYKFNPHTGKLATVVSLGTVNGGGAPACRLVNDGAGSFWGTSEFASHTSNPGVLYKVGIANGAFTHLLEFSESGGVAPGAFPIGGLVRESDGTLYGVTTAGGILRATGQAAGGGQIFAVGPKVLSPPAPMLSAQAGAHLVVGAAINPQGISTTAYFRYGEEQDFSSQTAPQALGAGTKPVNITADLTGLQPATRYFVQLVTETAGGPTYSAPVAFFTLASALEVVAAQGDSVPGGFTLKSAGPPAIDGAGNVAFRATLAGSGLSAATSSSLLLSSGGVLTEVVQTRSASNPAASTFTLLSDPVLSSGGALSFIGTLKSGSQAGGSLVTAANNQAIFVYQAGTATLALQKGQPIETGGPTYKQFLSAGLNHAGGLVVLAALSDSKVSPAFLASDLSGQLHWLAKKGSDFAGFQITGSTQLAQLPFDAGQARSVEMESGNVALLLQGAGHSQAIGLATPTANDFTLSLFAQSGSTYASFSEPAIDAQGDLSFCGTYTGSAKTARFFRINIDANGFVFSRDFRVGTVYNSPFPSLTFKSLGDPQLSAYGQYAFIASWKDLVRPAGTQGIWSKNTHYADTSSVYITVAGDSATDGMGGVFKSYQQLAVPSDGRPIFAATLTGVPAARNGGVWALCAGGLAPAPVVLKGLGLEVRGATKTVSRIDLFPPASGAMGQNRGLEPASQRFVFQATFTDGTWAIYKGQLPDYPIVDLPP